MIPILEPIFQGPLAELGNTLVLSPIPPAGAIPATQFTDESPVLVSVLQRYAAHLRHDGKDLRPVASAWSMAYIAALLPPVCAAATVLQHVFPIAIDQTFVTMAEDGTPVSFHITSMGARLPNAGAAERYTPLINHHLAPLFNTLSVCSRVPRKILWGNTARHLLGIFETAGQLLPHMPLIASDQDHLLHSSAWGGLPQKGCPLQPNPLHARDRSVRIQENGDTKTLRLHRQCCLYYLLPELGYCGACPLDPRFRGQHSIHTDGEDIAPPTSEQPT